MSYLVLARRFRPQTFESIVGQEHVSVALANAIVRGRVPHALLLTGPRGVGKTTSARVFARALNCTGREIEKAGEGRSEEEARRFIEPCGECPNCKEIARSASIAVREIDGASNNSVENVRELIDSLRSMPPAGSRYKIYIIDEVHMLSTAAFNALLKSLEEPPPHTVFIFATTDPQKIPETVLSRCQRYDFRRLSTELIARNLREIAVGDEVQIDDAVLQFIARKSNGGMRDAQSMLDRLLVFSHGRIELPAAQQIFGVVDRDFFHRLLQSVISEQPDQSLLILEEVFRQSLDMRGFVSDFLAFWREVFIAKLASEKGADSAAMLGRTLELSADETRTLLAQVKTLTAFDAGRLFELAEEISNRALQSSFPRYVFEAGLVKMATLPSLRPIAEVLSELRGGPGDAPNVRRLDSAAETRSAVRPEAPPPAAAFNPSWHEFVNHVKNCSEHVLAAFLRRVGPRHFTNGVLELEGTSFDVASLKENDALQGLKRALASYSPGVNWKISFHELSAQSEPTSTPSIAALETEAAKERAREVDEEMRSSPLIQSVLNAYPGSKVDKVSILKE